MDQKFMWMRELLGRLEHSNHQWQTAAGAMKPYLARAIECDLGEFRRLCQSVRRDVLAGLSPDIPPPRVRLHRRMTLPDSRPVKRFAEASRA